MKYKYFFNKKIIIIAILTHFILSFTFLQYSYLDTEFGSISKIIWRILSYPLLVWLLEINCDVLIKSLGQPS